MELSSRVRELALSVTLALDARAKALAAQGHDVVNMSVGEPDFPAPACAQDAAVARIRSGDVRYTQAGGLPSLREALAEHLAETRGGTWSAREVCVCHSGKHALAAGLFSLLEEGDEVLIPLPAWASYFEEVRITGATPVLVPPAPGARIDVAALAAYCTERTKGILVNSPSNPTGLLLSREETEALTSLAASRDLWILSDEIYRPLTYDGIEAVSPASMGADARSRTLIVDGASKAFAMTGYRIGYAAGPENVIDGIVRLNSQFTGAPNTVSQVAYEAALRSRPPELEEMRASFAERRDLILEGLAALGLETPRPGGAFYVFPDVTPFLDGEGSVEFCEALLEAEKLALVPGKAFEAEGHVRLSYATSPERIREGLARLGRFLETRGLAQIQPARSTNQ